MSTWDDLQKAIDAGAPERVARLVIELDGTERRALAKELPSRLKELRAASAYGSLDLRMREPLLVAGAGTISGPAAAAAWLCHRELRTWWGGVEDVSLDRALTTVTADRPAEWRIDVAHRVAARLRVSDVDAMLWHAAAALIKAAGAIPPVSDGFVVGWAGSGVRAEALGDDPFLDTLLPKLFEVDGVGAVLANDATWMQWDRTRKSTWASALSDLARVGRIERATLLDGCVSRFLRGGTAHGLRWFVQLHDALEPTDDETAARVRDYVRLLPAAPPTVADLALRQVRRADDLGRLDADLFTEAADALLFRPEKKLVRAALTWLDRTARERDRAGAAVRALTAVFTSDAVDLRDRAVKIAVKHAARASEAVREEVRNAAGALPAALRSAISAAFGEVTAVIDAEPPTGPPPFVPRELPAPIGSLTELAGEFATRLHSEEDWPATERFLAALVDFAHRDPAGTREALRTHADNLAPWLTKPDDHPYMRGRARESWIQFPVQNLLLPGKVRTLSEVFASLLLRRSHSAGTAVDPQLMRFLKWRLHEIASAVGTVPLLLATPTEGSGHIDPDVLVDRLERLEAAGCAPGPADLLQAMLRVPREIDPAAVVRAKGLSGEAGRKVAAWLAAGGLADPAVTCTVLDTPSATVGGRGLRLPTHVLPVVEMPGDSEIDRLCVLPEPDRRNFGTRSFDPHAGHWPAVLPSHRDIVAAHLIPHLAGWEEYGWNQGALMLGLAEADGPAGAATGTFLAHSLANQDQDERAKAVEALLVLTARGALPAAETGTALGRLAALGRIPLPRTLKALTAAADAGAHAGVWTILATALPPALPEPGGRAPAGLPAMITLAARLAETTRAEGAIPEIAEVAARGGTSRLVTESARLHRTLTAT
ncbi:DUF6493 family protein [Actinomadura chokoriensis]|uniref:DUF6493 family protein n=1 Tax=Actinomadura chokoriensis TaxID=454156 RepID=UPI0031F81350